MSDKIKLTYFNFRGRAEVSRLMLKYKDVDFEDCRINQDQWKELKPSKIYYFTESSYFIYIYL